ncbi:hypothetical protein N332_06050, partial [Mesitornis unicolor]
QGVGPNGPVCVKVPFFITDLMTWKEAAGVYTKDPEKVGRIMETILRIQDPDWNDIQVILDTLLDEAEKGMVLRTAKTQAEVAHVAQAIQGTVDQNFPSADTQWDPNMMRGERYQRWILFGIKHAMPKAMNWSNLYEIKQHTLELPS